ncbi:hypothetical protein [Pectobacterium atrosepticum]|uniref:hypothetical protein n=1 Tax=Pectobacterium atrosepticum TaxID=29471 RepID=UPI0008FBFDC1|nr:hypothetical protein [Pectobacterium atrosepticum]ATY90257.1 hypothetical protein CVS35_07760 [Pectobacterium atrosepticum]MCA6977011.1 hypothetical protein [Pectobacterium atrosepticum]MCL6317563.1 hypothetical protein [Pectobacterium atrosepticum]MCL6321631.1 hypothetical protein [Pectobacterium atrosepticum]PWD54571.1 hypothetical protein DF214_20995 [Pectobacterium atrosepticum]
MKVILFSTGVILVVLAERGFGLSLLISQLMAKAIPVRGAKFRNPAEGNLSGIFAFRGLVD